MGIEGETHFVSPDPGCSCGGSGSLEERENNNSATSAIMLTNGFLWISPKAKDFHDTS